MELNFNEVDKLLTFKIINEIDDCNVQKIRGRVDYEIQRYMPKKIVLDFSGVTFMDSSGIGFVIGRYKFANMIGAELEICNLTKSVEKIFEMSGILRLISISQNI